MSDIKRLKATKDFYWDELLPKEVYDLLDESLFKKLISEDVLKRLQKLRDIVGVAFYINNWANNGRFGYSGLRQKDCKIGSKYSKHKLGYAFDIKCKDMKKLFSEIENSRFLISRYENPDKTKSWAHVEFGTLYFGGRPNKFNP